MTAPAAYAASKVLNHSQPLGMGLASLSFGSKAKQNSNCLEKGACSLSAAVNSEFNAGLQSKYRIT